MNNLVSPAVVLKYASPITRSTHKYTQTLLSHSTNTNTQIRAYTKTSHLNRS